MATNEIITIINNSGKVISTGKQLVNIFKEAQAAYREKKESVKADRAARAGLKRAQTFDVTPRSPSHAGTAFVADGNDFNNFKGGEYVLDDRRALPEIPSNRRRSLEDGGDDTRSHASSRSAGRRSSQQGPARAPLALTEGNLKTHSVVSSVAPSKAPSGYKHYPDPPTVVPSVYDAPPPGPGHLVRHRTEPVLPKKKKSIDMGLAYGDIPPDLADRHDLGPLTPSSPIRGADRERDFQAFRGHGTSSSPRSSASDLVDVNPDEAQALGLMDKIEDFLEEAHCVHHSATNMIASLQERPEAAAAVALSLAELSALVGKMSPAFLAFIKGGSPAVFALLASPQFLIGTGIAAGVTVIMFGGWKIIKRIADGVGGGGAKQMEAPIAMRAMPVPGTAQTVVSDATEFRQLAAPPPPAPSDYETNVEELSSVERWRRGIQPEFGVGSEDDNNSQAEVDLLSKEAERVLKLEKDRIFSAKFDEEVDPDDSVSQIGVRARSYSKYKSYRSRHSSSRKHRDDDIPERRSSRRKEDDGSSRVSSGRRGSKDDDGESRVSERGHRSHRGDREREKERERRDHKDEDGSVAGSERSYRSSSHRERREKERGDKERGEKERGEKEGDDGASVASSERSYRSTRSSRSHRDKGDKDYDDKSIISRSSKHGGTRVGVKAIIPEEDEEKDDVGGKGDKPKKANMLKQLFKGKLKDYIKEEREKASSASSVMV
ncbi:hypothetical protein QBC43DRAFT_201782 [Cladorrhinum sp. PSN259]|nr:hypothetical protein QBC43DRAFT_201782 [Cladorrhinum sp. PSN259]